MIEGVNRVAVPFGEESVCAGVDSGRRCGGWGGRSGLHWEGGLRGPCGARRL